ncbi:unnamed protein product [Mytilus coruscus]|uniref:Uncharacterized protein n=1 Tax=Mytilus coruscus TaxID=42192 RepID=A0A6J8CHU5_MYTCO|nr:unnamed protein product [Mytilus coruscus]
MSLQASVANDSEGSNVLNHLGTNLGTPRLNNSGKLSACENLESSKLDVMDQTSPKMLISNTVDANQTLPIVSTNLSDIHDIRIDPNELSIAVAHSEIGTSTVSNNPGDMGNRYLYEQEIAHLKDCLCKKKKLLRAKDSTIYKLQTDISSLEKELTTSRSYIITLGSDK